MEPTSHEFEISKQQFLDSYFLLSKKAILEETLFPLNLKLLSADAPDLTRSEYTREELMVHCSKDTLGYFIKQFQALIPGWIKIDKGIVKIDRSRGGHRGNKLLDESQLDKRLDPKMKDKMQNLYNYLTDSKEMSTSELLHNILFKSGTFDDNIYNMDIEFEVLLFLAPHWMSRFMRNNDTIYRFNKQKTEALKADIVNRRMDLITESKGKPGELLGSKTIHQLVELRQFFVRKEQEHDCYLCQDKLFPIIAPCSNDILALKKLAMLPCSHYFHRNCILDRLKIDMNQEANEKKRLAKEVRGRRNKANHRELEQQRAVYAVKAEMSRLNWRGTRYERMKKLRKCEEDLENTKAEVERYSKELKVLEESVVPKCPVCLKTVSFP